MREYGNAVRVRLHRYFSCWDNATLVYRAVLCSKYHTIGAKEGDI